MDEPGPHDSAPPLRDKALDDLLDAFSDAGPAPGGGGAAVIVVALSASLCAMAARLSSRQLATAEEVAAEALSIRHDMAPLCDQDSEDFLRVLAVQRLPAGTDPTARRRRLISARSEASVVPMATVRAGARLARLAATLAREGNPAVRGDAVVAAVLGGAGAEAAGALVRINLSEVPHDARLAEVAVLLDDAGKWVNQARSTH